MSGQAPAFDGWWGSKVTPSKLCRRGPELLGALSGDWEGGVYGMGSLLSFTHCILDVSLESRNLLDSVQKYLEIKHGVI